MIYKGIRLVILLTITQSSKETTTPDGIRNKINTSGMFQVDSSNNAAAIVGVVCGIIIVALLVAFIAYVFFIRRTTIPVAMTAEQGADVLSTPKNIYAVPDRVAGGAAGEDTYTGLRFTFTSSDTNIDDSTVTYVNISNVNTNTSMNQQC